MREITKGLIILTIILALTFGIYAYERIDAQVLKTENFAEIFYVGYFENNSVFNSTFSEDIPYDAPFDVDEYNITPLKIYYSEEIPSEFPDNWIYGDLGFIENLRINEIPGLYEGLNGIKIGEEKIIELDAKEAFGLAIKNGTIFNTSIILGFNETFEVLSVGGVTVDLRLHPEIDKIITMPEMWYDMPLEPHWIWKNASKIISFNYSSAVFETTPNKLNNLTIPGLPWDESVTTEYNENEIILIITPPLGTFSFNFYGQIINGNVLEITEDIIKLEYYFGNETYPEEMNRTYIFDRQIELPIIFNDVQKVYIEDDLRNNGYSFHELAGNDIIFRVKLHNVYRVS
jgi:FKBP-type peptidyl-prolyl cis-trans isomerase 2